MLKLECILGEQKFKQLFSMPTPELNEWINFLKKVMSPSKDPRAQRKISLDIWTLCLSSRLHFVGTT